MKIFQIVPRLPPAIDGVGDYAAALASELWSAHGIQTQFVVGDRSWEGDGRTTDCRVGPIAASSAKAVPSVLAESPGVSLVLLHYVGYGYQKRGCPVWLVRGLQRWLSRCPERRLMTVFHELFAFGPPWRSSFWASPLQRMLAKQLARLSWNCVTNLRQSAEMLSSWRGSERPRAACLPVFSNVGEPVEIPGLAERRRSMIVFGTAQSRRLAYTRYLHDLEEACFSLDISQVVDIGPGKLDFAGIQQSVVRKGALSRAEVSNEMKAAKAGFFTCPIPLLGKSGIFAAYAAHGLLPVTFSRNHGQTVDGLVQGKHWLPAGQTERVNAGQWETVSSAVQEWYSRHALAAHAEIVAAQVGKATSANADPLTNSIPSSEFCGEV